MRLTDFSYALPDELIARKPCVNRTDSRLLQLDGATGNTMHGQFTDILDLVQPGDLMVFNNTRVIPARVFAQKETGGKLEILVERVVDAHNVLAHIRSSKSPKPGSIIILQDGTRITMQERAGALFCLAFADSDNAFDILDRLGQMPLPPYIDRACEEDDKERYQTVYAKHKGAVAAPTAGLHFDESIMAAIKDKGVDIAFVTLHVGAGTFQPVRVDDIKNHQMHSERMHIDAQTCEHIRATKAAGKRVIAVGTTSVRTLETAAKNGEIAAYSGDTDIFIYPGFDFKVVDALVTNFHLPESTLMMLVSAFAGFTPVMRAYREAVEEKYRFFSYGDAMFITRNNKAHLDIPSGPTNS